MKGLAIYTLIWIALSTATFLTTEPLNMVKFLVVIMVAPIGTFAVLFLSKKQ